jgi:hypothetical protein
MKIIKTQLNESREDTYDVGKCDINLYYGELTYKGHEINDISAPEISFTFYIDMDIKSYGIRGISLYNPEGPSEIELEVSYYTGEDDDESEDIVTIPLDWENVNEDDGDNGWIGYENRIEIRLKNDESGNIVVDSMTLFKNSF